MKIVVTGSSGRLGSAVVRQLVARGHEVIPVDQNAKNHVGAAPTRVMNLTDYPAFREAIDGAGAICHLGNIPDIGQKAELVEKFVSNVRANYVVFEAAFDAQIRKVVFASSIQAYGLLSSRRDMPESYSKPLYLPIDEDHPLLPCQPYPLSKSLGEATAESFVRRDPRMQAVSLRFTAIIHDKNQHWCMRAATDDRWLLASLATYVHTEDAARAVWLACQLDRPGHSAFNVVAAQSPCSWALEHIQKVYGSVPPFKHKIDASQGLITPWRASEILGFTAELAPDGSKLPEFQKA